MDRYRKGRTVERVLFTILVAALGAGGFLYERFRTELPGWQLVGLISVGLCACYIAYRFALNIALRKLEP